MKTFLGLKKFLFVKLFDILSSSYKSHFPPPFQTFEKILLLMVPYTVHVLTFPWPPVDQTTAQT